MEIRLARFLVVRCQNRSTTSSLNCAHGHHSCIRLTRQIECLPRRPALIMTVELEEKVSSDTLRGAIRRVLSSFSTLLNSGGVRAKMHDVLLARPEYKKTVFHDADGDSRYVLIKPSEPGKEIIVTTPLYDVPKPE